jgi:hypothetical protein
VEDTRIWKDIPKNSRINIAKMAILLKEIEKLNSVPIWKYKTQDSQNNPRQKEQCCRFQNT